MTFTHNNASSWHFYGKKFGTLVDNQALMWVGESKWWENCYLSNGLRGFDTSCISRSNSSRLPALNLYRYLITRWICLCLYARQTLLLCNKWPPEWCSNEAHPNRCTQCKLSRYTMYSPWDTSDWVMTSNGVYQRSGLNFTLMSGVTFGTFNGTISNSPLINATSRWNETTGTKLTTYGRKTTSSQVDS